MNWLLDTNVISELRKPRPNENVIAWYDIQDATQLHTSSMNIAELVYGAECETYLPKRRELLRWIDEDIRIAFSDRVHGITENILVRWRVVARLAEINKTRGQATDLLIAAVALENKLSIATRDVAPFVATGVPTLNPFTGERFNGA